MLDLFGELPVADASLAVSIVAAAISAASAGIAWWAIRQSQKANQLAEGANQLAQEANDQAEQIFEEGGSKASVVLEVKGEVVLVMIRSIGRLDVIVEDVLLEWAGQGKIFSFVNEILGYNFPVSLRPTEVSEQQISTYTLASLSRQYGGRHEWRLAPVVAGDASPWSEPYFVNHPDEPTLAEQLEEFNGSLLWSLVQRLNRGDLEASDREGLAATHAELGVRLDALRAKSDESHRSLPQRVSTMLVNAERNHAEAGARIREI